MEVDVLNMNGEKVRTIELPAEIFEAPLNVDLMHQAYVRQMANARLGTHKTKTRHEVSGGGRKPWRQKGTGRPGRAQSGLLSGSAAAVSSPHSRAITARKCRAKCVGRHCAQHFR
jgi:large subunit ribosomal protein L4